MLRSTCRRFVAGHRCRAEGDAGRLGGASPRPRRRHLHRPARRVRACRRWCSARPTCWRQAHRLRAEFCIAVDGVVEIRPEGNANPEIATGDIEVNATSLTVLGESAPLPFQLDEPAGEEARLKYRYLDLRREGPGSAIRLRSKVNAAAREVLAEHDFVEIETPTMTRSTPEGARDFLVPARLQPGSFYALPQSPQLFKQLLMVAGMERYYQIARCYRDEDFRADRQPEFTQLDMEMSFVDADDVIAVSEEILKALWALIGYDLPTPLPRITYADAMRRFGSDKPDLRFGLELVECTDYFSDTPFRVFQAPYVGAVVMPGGASQPRRTLDGWQEFAKQRGHKGLAYVLVAEDGTLGGPVAKNLTDAERDGLAAHVGATAGGLHLLLGGTGEVGAGAARRDPHRDRQAAGPDRPERVGVHLGGGLAAVRARRRGDRRRRRGRRVRRVDGGAPRVHLAQAGVRGHVRHRSGHRAGQRLRHRVQRQRDRRRLDPYPPPRRPGTGVRDDGHRPRRSPGEVRIPVGRLHLRRAAARRHRVRLGPHHRAAGRHGLDPRGHRVPEVRRRRRPADRRARADHAAAAQGIGNRRQARRRTARRRVRACASPRRSCRSALAIRARTGAPEITTSTMVNDWWVWPRARTCSVGTPAASSAAAYASPSSRRGSNSAVTTIAGGSPDRSSARKGANRGSRRSAASM